MGKQITKAFREEILHHGNNSGGGANNQDGQEGEQATGEDNNEEAKPDYTKFRLPSNTKAISIDDSKIQRKLLGKFFDFADIPSVDATVVGDGRDEIMGFEDFVVNMSVVLFGHELLQLASGSTFHFVMRIYFVKTQA